LRPLRSADDAVETYLRLRERLSAPRSASLTVSWGESFASKCRGCGHGERQELNTRAAGWSWRCARCGRPWTVEATELPRGAVQLSPRGGGGVFATQLSDLASLGLMLDRLGRWHRACLLLAVARGLSATLICEHLADRHPRAKTRPASAWAVGRLLREARQDLEARLRRAGLLA
jgi:hypothetical protein